MGFPLEILTLLGGGLLSGFMTIWSMKIKAAEARNRLQIEALVAQSDAHARARDYQASPDFAFTRRLIALIAVLAIIVLPKVVPLVNPNILVTIGYTEFIPGFLFFTDGRDAVTWRTFNGLTFTPLDTHTVSAIIGFYFGASVVKNA